MVPWSDQHTYIHTYIHTYVYTHIFTVTQYECMWACILWICILWICTQTYIHIHIHIHIYIYTYTHTHNHAWIHKQHTPFITTVQQNVPVMCHTDTLVCPSLCTRSNAWASMAGFHQGSCTRSRSCSRLRYLYSCNQFARQRTTSSNMRQNHIMLRSSGENAVNNSNMIRDVSH